YVLAAICLLIGFMAFMQFYKNRNIEDAPMYKLLMMEPQTVTGINAQSVTSKYGAGIKFINATLFVSNKQAGVLSVNENELELLKQYIEKHNSNLAFERTEVKA
ncbi:MAG TPA: hypothetical protein VFJ43_10455, partial [Bacteroidia bacterium]|nr:hypothetical protein [Bacteroidia bacterium]